MKSVTMLTLLSPWRTLALLVKGNGLNQIFTHKRNLRTWKLLNSVQWHIVCNTIYCLLKNIEGVQSFLFLLPVEECQNTQVEYEKAHSKNGNFPLRPKVKKKWHQNKLTRRFQLQSWRTNFYIQPIIDYTARLKYVWKYASKSGKISNVVKETFTSFVQNLQDTEDTKKVVRKVMIKSAGERGFSAQEVMHHVMSLKLVS